MKRIIALCAVLKEVFKSAAQAYTWPAREEFVPGTNSVSWPKQNHSTTSTYQTWIVQTISEKIGTWRQSVYVLKGRTIL